ncbi:MAG TPA: ABC transporter substrate-binding protein [Candidatus Limnocylindrales bacterium]|nr:ABC transporter substrate-binding protein [Candidatus Limnocylindrales bacterium]
MPIPTSTLPPLTATPAAADLLRLALPADPGGFTPAPVDDGAAIVDGFVYAPLYRLDARLVPQPALAAAAANVSADGRIWNVPLKAGLRFSDGSTLTSADVVRTYQLALSPDCPFADLCKAVQAAVTSVATGGSQRAVFHLARPDAALGAEVLAQLGIVSGAALDASLGRLLTHLGSVDAGSLTTLTDGIATATNADACLDATPPSSCDLATYSAQLEAILRPTGIALPERALLLGPDGKPDASAYGAALYAQAQALATALGATGTDRLAAAFPLLDLRRAPVASGPFRVAAYEPGTSLDLVRWQAAPGQGAPARIHIVVLADPAIAATALETGDLDWLPELGPDQVAAVAAQAGLHAALRPSSTYRAIVFNVRAGHPYADPTARLAFATCIDRPGDLDTATGGQGILAQGPVQVGSWAAASDPGWPAYDPARARGLLSKAGWQPGPDGIMTRGGLRLSSQLIVRTGRPDLLAFATAAAEQLRTCGIDLQVLSQDPSGQLLLAQLEYPNTFDTVLVANAAGPDPDAGLGLFHSRHITTAENPADGNIGGWSDPAADTLIDAAVASADTTARAHDYGQLQRLLAQQVPILPISWDSQAAAVSQRLHLGDDPVDPSRAGYDATRLEWTLAP